MSCGGTESVLVANSTGEVKSGYMKKYTGFMFKSWKQRYVTIYADGQLAIFEAPGSGSGEVLRMRKDCTSLQVGFNIRDRPSPPDGDHYDQMLAVVTRDKTHYLLASDKDELNAWYGVLQQAKSPQSPGPPPGYPGPPPQMTPGPPPPGFNPQAPHMPPQPGPYPPQGPYPQGAPHYPQRPPPPQGAPYPHRSPGGPYQRAPPPTGGSYPRQQGGPVYSQQPGHQTVVVNQQRDRGGTGDMATGMLLGAAAGYGLGRMGGFGYGGYGYGGWGHGGYHGGHSEHYEDNDTYEHNETNITENHYHYYGEDQGAGQEDYGGGYDDGGGGFDDGGFDDGGFDDGGFDGGDCGDFGD